MAKDPDRKLKMWVRTHRMALRCYDEGHHEEAMDWSEKARTAAESMLDDGDGKPMLAATLMLMASLSAALGDRRQEREMLLRALKLRRRSDVEPIELAETMTRLGAWHTRESRHGAAEVYLLRSLQLIWAGGNVTDTTADECLENLAYFYEHTGRFSDATALFQQVLDHTRTRSPVVGARLLNRLANVALSLEQRSQCGSLLQQAAVLIREAGLEDTDIGVCNDNLVGLLWTKEMRYDEALGVLRRVLRKAVKLDPPNCETVANIWGNMAVCLRALNRELSAKRALRIALKIYGSNELASVTTRYNLGRDEEVLAIAERHPTARDAHLAICIINIAAQYKYESHPQAERALRLAIAKSEMLFGAEHFNTKKLQSYLRELLEVNIGH